MSDILCSQFMKKIEERNVPLHSLVLYKDGEILFEHAFAPFRMDDLHRMFSVAKSFTTIGISLLLQEGKISLEDPIVSYFPEKYQEGSDSSSYLEQLTIRDMLMMRTCHSNATYDKFDLHSDWVGSFFTKTPTKEPGRIFDYDTSAPHVLAALIEKLTGKSMTDYIRDSLPELGLSDRAYMLKDGDGVSMGGTGLIATTEDLLKLGILFLNEGAYEGKQLLPKTFMQDAIRPLTPVLFNIPVFSGDCGYGYTIWTVGMDTFLIYGMGGQLVIADKALKLLLVTTGDLQRYTGGIQLVYDLFTDCLSSVLREKEGLPPAQRNFSMVPALSADPSGTYSLTYPASSALFDQVNLSLPKTNAADGVGCLTFEKGDNKKSFSIGIGRPAVGIFPDYNMRYFSSARLIDPHTLFVHLQICDESVGSVRMELHFDKKSLLLRMDKKEETMFNEYKGTYLLTRK